MRFHLNTIETQEEYEVILDLLEENKKDVVAKINCKIHFLWSFREFYHNLMIKSEKKINHFNETIQKSNKIIESLNGKSFF